MEIEIIRTIDAQLLATLNRDVQQLHHDLEPEIFKPYSKDEVTHFFEMLLSDPCVSAYVAMIDHVPAAYILLKQVAVEENWFKYSHTVLHIDQICVEGSYKGKGIGKALVDYAKQIANDKNIKRIEMNYWSKNSNSGEFFRSQGFANYNERLFLSLE